MLWGVAENTHGCVLLYGFCLVFAWKTIEKLSVNNLENRGKNTTFVAVFLSIAYKATWKRAFLGNREEDWKIENWCYIRG